MRHLITALSLCLAAPALAAPKVTLVAEGFVNPWAVAFLPEGSILVTEKGGDLLLLGAGKSTRLKGVPKVAEVGQGGLLDVMVPEDFTYSREIFLSYAKKLGKGQGTALARATLAAGSDRLTDVRDLFVMTDGSSGGNHFGSRIIEAADGTLFLTVGERGDAELAQDLSRHNGSVIRINRDGTIPEDNPFVGQDGAQPEIYSYGHRNPQGAALDADGTLWVDEHGARGGDELNAIKRGANYGWPVISYGTHYSGAKIGEGTAKQGMEQPEFFWDPSIAPSGMAIYSGRLNDEWKGDFLIGSLKFDMISRIDRDTMSEAERIQTPETKRVRDVIEGPDGAVYFLSEINGALYRLEP
ncbi:PQQ-dependent sugar dehydrogenase [Donghicola mangrovi]|uniref:PQQ-dependent sugar dehydrogenase n=1 Tax=Donghicola mangrovi TaxID=2729614 RepID=A0A850Q063_9RHOB|nr:PQQ-dependent sugar dehydrogenase [Donghicola mangrovi]NVO22927.1 PQQ-dependent sugar dehydrogenase [Donghicola mangrovi]